MMDTAMLLEGFAPPFSHMARHNINSCEYDGEGLIVMIEA